MSLREFGFTTDLEERFKNESDDFEIGRVISEHKERYVVKTEKGEVEAEITGNMRFSATSREDFPAVGDWVSLTVYDQNFGIIHKVFPRKSVIKRQAVGQYGEIQIIAVNVDFAFIMQAVDRDFSINRMERYLAICTSSNVQPIIVLSKTDLISHEQLHEILDHVKHRIFNYPVVTISNETREGYESVFSVIEKGKTYCLLGSSGVGKSTLLNNLSGKSVMKTDVISQSTNRGKHVTTHRELIALENGGIMIDNPGMREVGLTDVGEGLELIFSRIEKYSKDCRYQDCTHVHESGCAVIAAVNKGEIDQDSYENYLKMKKETDYFESTVLERKKKEKVFGRMLKNYKKDQKNRE